MENSNRNYGNRTGWNDDYDDNRDWRNRNYDQNMRDRNDMSDWDSYNQRHGSSESSRNWNNSRNWDSNRNWENNRNWDRGRNWDDNSSGRSGGSWADRQNENYGLGDTSQGSGNYGHRDPESNRYRSYGTGNLGRNSSMFENRHEDRERGNRYNDDNYDYRNQHRDRDWWDRTTDEVASWFGDSDAERRRRMDRMRGPHSGKGPKGYTRTDEQITNDINDRLYNDSYIDASEIEVRVTNGDVTLSGTVDDKQTKRRAEDCAESVTGVKDVANNLKVNRNTSDLWSRPSDTDRNDTNSRLDQSNDLIRKQAKK